MRLLLIAPRIRGIAEVKNFSGVLSFFLAQELERAGVELHYDEPLHNKGWHEKTIEEHYDQIDLQDHVLALPLRYFNRLPQSAYRVLKKRIGKGKITQVHDRQLPKPVADCNFTISDQGNNKWNHSIGWAASPSFIQPLQDWGELRILVDHPDYVQRGTDKTEEILQSCAAFHDSALWQGDTFKTMRIRHLIDKEFIDYKGAPVAKYTRWPVPYLNCCLEYSKTNIFFVTHHESCGLSALEANMAGALVVAPKGFINPDRAKTLRMVEYTGAVPWDEIMMKLNIPATREIAKANSWQNVAGNIINWFERSK